MLSRSLKRAQNWGQISGLAGGSSSPVTQYGWKQKIPAATKSTSFLHLATIGYLLMLVHGTRAVVKLDSKPIKNTSYQLKLTFPSFSKSNFFPFSNSIPDETVGPCASKKTKINTSLTYAESPHVSAFSLCLQ